MAVGTPTAGALSAGVQLALSDYLTQVRQLLRDAAPGALYTDTDLTTFINSAIKRRDLDLGWNRVKITFTLTSGVYDYSFSTIAGSGVVVDGNPTAVLQDILSIIIIPLGSATSAVRYPLPRWPYSKLAFMLSTTYPTYPSAYAIYGTSNIIFGPPPAGNYPVEFDFVAYTPDLVNTTDKDPMSYPYTEPVKYLAASYAKLQAQRFDESEKFMQVYQQSMNTVRGRAKSIAISQPWTDLRS